MYFSKKKIISIQQFLTLISPSCLTLQFEKTLYVHQGYLFIVKGKKNPFSMPRLSCNCQLEAKFMEYSSGSLNASRPLFTVVDGNNQCHSIHTKVRGLHQVISKVPSCIRILEVGKPKIANGFLNVPNLCLGTICTFERWVRFIHLAQKYKLR